MKTFRTLALAAVVMLSACSKDDNGPSPSVNNTGSFGTITLSGTGGDQARWTYQGSPLTRMVWENLNGSQNDTVADITGIQYTGSRVSRIAWTSNGTKESCEISYQNNRLYKVVRKVTGAANWMNYELEYNAGGKVEQVNQYRTDTNGHFLQTIAITQLHYNSAGNVDTMVRGNATMALQYDNKPNAAYENNDLRVVTIASLSHRQPFSWVNQDLLFTLTPNNITQIDFLANGSHQKNTYTYDGSRLSSVESRWIFPTSELVNTWTLR